MTDHFTSPTKEVFEWTESSSFLYSRLCQSALYIVKINSDPYKHLLYCFLGDKVTYWTILFHSELLMCSVYGLEQEAIKRQIFVKSTIKHKYIYRLV